MGNTSLARNNQRNIAALVHLGAYSWLFLPYIAPLVIPIVALLVWSEDEVIRAHAAEELNFQISMIILSIVMLFLSMFLIGIPFLFALAILGLILPIVAAAEAAKGRVYRYPLTWRLIQ